MRIRRRGVLPGFGLSFGYTIVYLGLLVLLPLGALVVKTSSVGLSEFFAIVTDARALAAYRVSFLAAFAGAAVNGVFGILLAFGMAFPMRKLILIPIPIPMPAWLFVTLYGIMELVLGVTQTSQGVAHFAHLGGMATGFVMIRYWQAQGRRRQ